MAQQRLIGARLQPVEQLTIASIIIVAVIAIFATVVFAVSATVTVAVATALPAVGIDPPLDAALAIAILAVGIDTMFSHDAIIGGAI
jgi:ABC-type thiamin/hydroxymethylpyrimidine transport system permease subunit